MPRWRFVLGIVAAALMVVSAAAHTFLGGKQIRAALGATAVPTDLTKAIGIGWTFGGVAMLAFGTIAIANLVARRNDPAASVAPLAITGAAYILFGLGALIVTGFDPFFLIFVVPGVLLAAALSPRRGPGRT